MADGGAGSCQALLELALLGNLVARLGCAMAAQEWESKVARPIAELETRTAASPRRRLAASSRSATPSSQSGGGPQLKQDA